jgi:ATP-dependent protease Clp ATPase subunit
MFVTILLVIGILSAIIGTIFSYKSAKGLELGRKLQQIALGQEKADYVLKVNDTNNYYALSKNKIDSIELRKLFIEIIRK